jgi:RimJ/RimL family protein N-acetyltransferase
LSYARYPIIEDRDVAASVVGGSTCEHDPLSGFVIKEHMVGTPRRRRPIGGGSLATGGSSEEQESDSGNGHERVITFDSRREKRMSDEVRLRNIEPDDLPVFYEQQLDVDATRMAAFPARDRAAFDAHWATNILRNPTAVNRTILADGEVAGNIGSWCQDGVRLVSYWIGKEHWGKGVATRALAAFLQVVTERPLYAHVAMHNVGSIRVLEKCGFILEPTRASRAPLTTSRSSCSSCVPSSPWTAPQHQRLVRRRGYRTRSRASREEE